MIPMVEREGFTLLLRHQLSDRLIELTNDLHLHLRKVSKARSLHKQQCTARNQATFIVSSFHKIRTDPIPSRMSDADHCVMVMVMIMNFFL